MKNDWLTKIVLFGQTKTRSSLNEKVMEKAEREKGRKGKEKRQEEKR